MDNTRRALMAERDKAIAARDWVKANALTKRIADLPLAGVAPLTEKDIVKYTRRAS